MRVLIEADGKYIVGEFVAVTKLPEHRAWSNMLNRCFNPTHPHYKDYGARGITVCLQWKDFLTFFMDIGPRPSPKYSLDRINNDGNYEPRNIRWALRTEQNRNKRNTQIVEHEGAKTTLAALAEKLALNLQTLSNRIAAGWPLEAAISYPKSKHYRTGELRKVIPRQPRMVKYKGQSMPLFELTQKHNQSYNLVIARLRDNWPIEDALTIPKGEFQTRNKKTLAKPLAPCD